MSNKQNDEIYDAIAEISGLTDLITVVGKILGRDYEHPLDFDEIEKLSEWLLAHDLEMTKECEELAIKAINNLTKGIE